jgi:hypothetical protein
MLCTVLLPLQKTKAAKMLSIISPEAGKMKKNKKKRDV